jgi:hypothetical protein
VIFITPILILIVDLFYPNILEESTAVESSTACSAHNADDNNTVPTNNTTPSKMTFTSALLPSQQQELENSKISQNSFVTGSNMNGGCVMTGRPSSRVLAPPGGYTSIKLG